jgi:hypothetical protein
MTRIARIESPVLLLIREIREIRGKNPAQENKILVESICPGSALRDFGAFLSRQPLHPAL